MGSVSLLLQQLPKFGRSIRRDVAQHSSHTIQIAEGRAGDDIRMVKRRNKRVCEFTMLLSLGFSDSPVDKCSTYGTPLSFHGTHSPEVIDITLASVSVKNPSDYFQITAHIWMEDAEEQT